MVLDALQTTSVDRFWSEVVGDRIPGSTRVPVLEIKKHLLSLDKDPQSFADTIADLGAGSGRSTGILKSNFPNAKVIPLDLSHSGLKASEYPLSVNASVDKLSFPDSSVDVISMCGVMTNLVHKDLDKSLALRESTAREIMRVLRQDGLCVISDFTRPHILSGYPVNYERHRLITHEEGTIAVFDPSKNVSFIGLDDNQVANLNASKALQRFAHHYKSEELVSIFTKAGLKADSYVVEIGQTPSGKPIDTITLSVTKR